MKVAIYLVHKIKKESAYKHINTLLSRGLQGYKTEPITFNGYHTKKL